MKCSCCAILRTSFPIRAILEHGRCLRGLVRQSTISLDVDGWCTMVSSKPLLLLSAVACLTLSCPLLATAQDTDSQQSSKSSNTGLMVRRFALHYNGSFKRISPDESTQRLTQKGTPSARRTALQPNQIGLSQKRNQKDLQGKRNRGQRGKCSECNKHAALRGSVHRSFQAIRDSREFCRSNVSRFRDTGQIGSRNA